jgi:hypothetical protein
VRGAVVADMTARFNECDRTAAAGIEHEHVHDSIRVCASVSFQAMRSSA